MEIVLDGFWGWYNYGMKRVVVIVGPTGSGKTGLGLELAERVGGEIISADSRAVYRGMDIGTAKPTCEERGRVRHWGIDLVEVGERFSAGDFKKYADDAIREICALGNVPFLVGGTGLYVDGVIYDYKFNDVVKKTCSDRIEMSSDFLVVGISWSREELRKRLELRVDKIFEQDIVGETARLVERYGWGSQAMKSNIYSIVWRMMRGEISEGEAKRLSVVADWHLAKRQMTWFGRNKKIMWMGIDEAKEYVYNIVNEQNN
jgi:tRNA dimethylallyltransferase